MTLSTIRLISCSPITSAAQELQAKITINHAQIQGTENRVFDNLQQTLEQFVNDRQWTNLQFRKNERIVCNFNITVSKYDKDQNIFTCKALIQANRPVLVPVTPISPPIPLLLCVLRKSKQTLS